MLSLGGISNSVRVRKEDETRDDSSLSSIYDVRDEGCHHHTTAGLLKIAPTHKQEARYKKLSPWSIVCCV